MTKNQIKNRIIVYSIIAIFYGCGILSFFMNLLPLGIILILLPSIALYILWKLPKYIIQDYCRQAEREYQLHKNDIDSDRIYLSGEQMRKFISGEVIDLKDGKTRPFSYRSIMEAKLQREQEEERNNERRNTESKS